MDKILTIFDHSPTSRGPAWTFLWQPTYVNVDISLTPTPFQDFFFQSKKNWKKNGKLCALGRNLHFLFNLKLNYLFFQKHCTTVESPLNRHSIVACFSEILSTWTFKRPPTYLPWKIVDIWPPTHPPHLVHVVVEWPLLGSTWIHTITLGIKKEFACTMHPLHLFFLLAARISIKHCKLNVVLSVVHGIIWSISDPYSLLSIAF